MVVYGGFVVQATILAACIAGASAFSAAPAMIRSRTSSGITGMRMQAKSASVPFLTRPAKLDGTIVGDAGFDPLGFTEKYDLKWLQESEIKHGRVAMLAVLGTLVQEIVRLPFEATSNPNPAEAFFQVPAGGLGQIFVTIGIIEHFSHNFKLSGSTMFSTGRKPGVFGFDPLGFGKNPDAFKRYELAEIKNGRLAMLGFSGIIHGAFITGKGPIAALTSLSYPY